MSKSRIIVVNDQDEIIGLKERDTLVQADIYRVAALWVVNSAGDILLAQRKFTKTHDPGKWGPAVAGTVDEGDISVYASKKILNAKKKSGEAALKKLGSATHGYPWIAKMAEEYERRVAPEARFVHALDKLVVHMNVILSGQHHARPTFEKYLETEKIARGKIAASFPDLLPYFEDLCCMFHERPEFFKQ